MNSDMNENTEEMPSLEKPKAYTLKVLFGPMFGCELYLPADDYFLIINPGLPVQDTSDGQHAAAYTQNTLYLPCDMPSPNVLLHLSASGEEEPDRYLIEIQGMSDSYSVLHFKNEVFNHDHIHFAIKHSDDEWSQEIKNFCTLSLFDAESSAKEKLDELNKKKNHILIIGSLILFLIVLASGFFWYKKMVTDQQVLTLNEVLTGSPTPLEIVRGRDNDLIYVLATKHQAFQWSQEALFKLRGNNSIVVPVLLSKKNSEVITQLAKENYPVLQIDFTRPQHPIIALYKSLTPAEEKKFKSIAFEKIPFALDIDTMVKTKPQLLQEARQGLDRLHIYYRQINTANGYALVVRDALSDSVLRALQHFISEFYHQWGSHIINFSINLDENWLQDKSYLDSSNGYLFLNPRHWYFPLNKEL